MAEGALSSTENALGRLGGIAAAPLGGLLLARGMKPRHVFLLACLFAVIASAATALLAWRAPRAASGSAEQLAR
jgi:hypothetical protein